MVEYMQTNQLIKANDREEKENDRFIKEKLKLLVDLSDEYNESKKNSIFAVDLLSPMQKLIHPELFFSVKETCFRIF